MIIGLTGFKQSGKDTAGRALVELGYERKAFATPIYEHLLILDPLIHFSASQATQLHELVGNPITDTVGGYQRLSWLVTAFGWDNLKVTVPEVRRLLQVYGTEVGRHNFGDDVWVDQALKGVRPADAVVFTDVRFPNELEAIHRLGGLVFRIVRPSQQRVAVEGVEGHESEQVLEGVDLAIYNGGTPEALQEKVQTIVTRWDEDEETPQEAFLRGADSHPVYGPNPYKPEHRPLVVKAPLVEFPVGEFRNPRVEGDDIEALEEVQRAPQRSHLDDMILEAAERNGEVPQFDAWPREAHLVDGGRRRERAEAAGLVVTPVEPDLDFEAWAQGWADYREAAERRPMPGDTSVAYGEETHPVLYAPRGSFTAQGLVVLAEQGIVVRWLP